MLRKKICSILGWNKKNNFMKKNYKINMACYSHTGFIRAHNEDNFSFDGNFMDEEHQSMDEVMLVETASCDNPSAALFDGMGGESAGEKASFAAAKTFTKLSEGRIWDRDNMIFVMHEMNEAVCREKMAGRYGSIGCTAAVIAFSEGKLFCANLGDSPIYQYSKRKLSQLSVHHTNEALLRAQGITNRKPGLTQFLGIEEEEYIIEPHIIELKLKSKDLYLLCSDGLTDMCSEEEITEILDKKDSLKIKTRQLAEAALNHGGRDNITIILCQIR